MLSCFGWLVGAASAAAQDTPQPRYLGAYQTTHADLRTPAALVFLPDGRLLIADAGNDQLVLAAGAQQQPVGPRELGALRRPGGLALASTGEVFVSDTGNHRVLVLSADFAMLRSFGERGAKPGQLLHPGRLAVHQDALYVIDAGNDRIAVFDLDGAHRRDLRPMYPASDGQEQPLRDMGDLAFDAAGNLYVTDLERQRIAVLDSSGAFQRHIGDHGAFAGLFARPGGITIAGDELFVADTLNHRVQVLTLRGQPLYEWGLHVVNPGDGEGRIHYPSAIALAPDGAQVAVAEGFQGRVQRFGWRTDPGDDALFRELIGADATAAHFGERGCIAGDYLAIVEPENHAVQIFLSTAPQPIPLTTIGGYGQTGSRFNRPTDVWLDEAGRLWVVDQGNRRISEFAVKLPPASAPEYSLRADRFVRSISFSALQSRAARAGLTGPLHVEAIERDAAGRFWLLDARNAAVLCFDSDWMFVGATGGFGDHDGALRLPTDLAFDAAGGRLAVADADRSLINIYDAQGQFESAVRAPPWELVGVPGSGAGPPGRPFGVAWGAADTLWMTDARFDAVAWFHAPRGAAPSRVGQFGRRGLGRNELFRPAGALFDAQRNWLLVLDHGNHRAMVFEAAQPIEFVKAFGARAYVLPTRSGGKAPPP